PGPIALEHVEAVRHRPPDHRAAAAAEVLMFVGHFFPPAMLLLLPLAFGKRHRKTHALLVNDRVAFAGNRNLVWGFWVDALLALRAELDESGGPTRVAVLEVVPGDPGAEPLRATAPPW